VTVTRPSRPRESDAWSAGRALQGARVLLTRGVEGNTAWSEALRRWGVHPVSLPCITITPLPSPTTRSALRGALEGATWLCLTSRRGAEAFAALELGALAPSLRVATVGRATADAATRLVRAPTLVAPAENAASLVETLTPHLAPHDVVVLAGSEQGADTLQLGITETGAVARRIDTYRTQSHGGDGEAVALHSLHLTAAFLASPSAVRGLVQRASIPDDLPLISIGPTTSAALRAAGLSVAAEAQTRSLSSMVNGLLSMLRDEAIVHTFPSKTPPVPESP